MLANVLPVIAPHKLTDVTSGEPVQVHLNRVFLRLFVWHSDVRMVYAFEYVFACMYVHSLNKLIPTMRPSLVIILILVLTVTCIISLISILLVFFTVPHS